MKTTTKKKSSCGEGEVTRGDETKLSDTFLRRKSLFEAELRIGVSRVSAKASHARSRDLNSCVKGDFFIQMGCGKFSCKRKKWVLLVSQVVEQWTLCLDDPSLNPI